MVTIEELKDRFTVKKRSLYVAESDVTKTIKTIKSVRDRCVLTTASPCGWRDSNKWVISFEFTEMEWESLIVRLGIIRKFRITDIPDNDEGAVYTCD